MVPRFQGYGRNGGAEPGAGEIPRGAVFGLPGAAGGEAGTVPAVLFEAVARAKSRVTPMSENELRGYRMPFGSPQFWRMGETLEWIAMDSAGLLALRAWQLGCKQFSLQVVRAIVGEFLALEDVRAKLERAQADAAERRADFAIARNRAAASAKRRESWEKHRVEEIAAHNLERGF